MLTKRYLSKKLIIQGFSLTIISFFVTLSIFFMLNREMLVSVPNIYMLTEGQVTYNDLKHIDSNVDLLNIGYKNVNNKTISIAKSNSLDNLFFLYDDIEVTDGYIYISETYANLFELSCGDKVKIDNYEYTIKNVFKGTDLQTSDIYMPIDDKDIVNLIFDYSKSDNISDLVIDMGYVKSAANGNNQQESALMLLSLIIQVVCIFSIITTFLIIYYNSKDTINSRMSNILGLKVMGVDNYKILISELMIFLVPTILGWIFGLATSMFLIIPVSNIIPKLIYSINLEYIYNNFNILKVFYTSCVFIAIQCVLNLFLIYSINVKKTVIELYRGDNEKQLKTKRIITFGLLLISIAFIIDNLVVKYTLIALTLFVILFLLPIFIIYLLKRNKSEKLNIAKSVLYNNQIITSLTFLILTAIIVLFLLMVSVIQSTISSVTSTWDLFLTQEGQIYSVNNDYLDETFIENISGIENVNFYKRIYPEEPVYSNKSEKIVNGYVVKEKNYNDLEDGLIGETTEGEAIIGTVIANVLNVSVGDYIILNGNYIKVCGITPSAENGSQIIYLDPKLYSYIYNENGKKVAYFDIEDRASIDLAIEEADDILKFRTTEEVKQSYINSIYLLIGPVVLLILAFTLIGVYQIFMLINQLLANSRKTLAILKSYGESGKNIFIELFYMLMVYCVTASIVSMVILVSVAENMNMFIQNVLGSNVTITAVSQLNVFTCIILSVLLSIVFATKYTNLYRKKTLKTIIE